MKHERTPGANDECLQDPLCARSPGARIRRFFPAFPPTLPHRIDYLMVQFYSAGGTFVVEVGRTGPESFTDGPWKDLPVDKITVAHIFYDRRRLTPRDAHAGWRGRDWFEFGPRSYDPAQPVKPQEFYNAIADQALAIFDTTGEPWLARPQPPDSGASRSKLEGPPPWPLGEGPFARFATLFPWNRPNMRIACLLAGPEPPALPLGNLAEDRRADDRTGRPSAAAHLDPLLPAPAGQVAMAAVRPPILERGQQPEMDQRVSGKN
jgi:hypothetical protein